MFRIGDTLFNENPVSSSTLKLKTISNSQFNPLRLATKITYSAAYPYPQSSCTKTGKL